MRIQKFGFELRKIGDVKSFYEEIDLVLHKTQSLNGVVGGSVKVQAVAHSLQKMFKVDSYFSACGSTKMVNFLKMVSCTG